MNDIRAIMANCKAIRERLRRPPNAVPDTGINLKRTRPEATPQTAEPEQSVPPLPDLPKVIPSGVSAQHGRIPMFRRKDLTFSNTLAFMAEEFSISHQDIRLHCRRRHYSMPRMLAIYLTNRTIGRSFKSMGDYLKMDHSTMLHARDKVQEMIKESMLCQQYVYSLEVRLLAAFDRITIPAECQSLLGCQKEQQDGNKGQNAVGEIFAVDKTIRSTFRDTETISLKPDLGG